MEKLITYFKDTYADVTRAQTAAIENNEGDAPGTLAAELSVGDLVLVRREPTNRREGPLRFQPRTYPDT